MEIGKQREARNRFSQFGFIETVVVQSSKSINEWTQITSNASLLSYISQKLSSH